MTTIILNQDNYIFDAAANIFRMSEVDVPFDTSYTLHNPTTRKKCIFNFSHSTGPEFDSETKFVYKADNGLILEVCNDARMVKIASALYLDAKIN